MTPSAGGTVPRFWTRGSGALEGAYGRRAKKVPRSKEAGVRAAAVPQATSVLGSPLSNERVLSWSSRVREKGIDDPAGERPSTILAQPNQGLSAVAAKQLRETITD